MRFFVFLMALFWAATAMAQTATVSESARVNMRSGKGENYRLIRVLPPQSEVQIVETEQDYAKVKAADGETGWVLSKFLTVGVSKSDEIAQKQAELEAAQKELLAARIELANLQRGMEAEPQSGTGRSALFLLLSLMGAFSGGVAAGILVLRAYYIKRLHGLRI